VPAAASTGTGASGATTGRNRPVVAPAGARESTGRNRGGGRAATQGARGGGGSSGGAPEEGGAQGRVKVEKKLMDDFSCTNLKH